MGKFRKKPVVIEAWKFDNGEEFAKAPEEFHMALLVRHAFHSDETYFIETLEGDHNVSVGDWIIKGVKGEFYPCKPDIFEQTYEEV